METSNPPLVMLVDGTEEAERIVEALETNGVRTVHAQDTIAAESLFVATLPNLIVLSLDDEGASAFCDLIGAIPRGSGVPVILVGRKSDKTLRAPIESTLRGEHAFVPRPVEQQALITALESLLAEEEAEPIAESAPPTPMEAALAGANDDTALATPTGDTGDLAAGDVEQALLGVTREPTQVLDEPTDLMNSSFGVGLDDFIGDDPITFGLEEGASPSGRMPWEVELEIPPVGDEDEVEAETNVAEGMDTNFDTVERDPGTDAASETDELAPWASTPGPPAAPEETQVLPHEAPERDGDAEGDEEEGSGFGGGVTELSADFRRVIDEVAHRLFPEASPEEYQDEHFEELNTVVPVVEQGTTYFEDLDEYSLDAMDTFAAQPGLNLSTFDGPLDDDGYPSATVNMPSDTENVPSDTENVPSDTENVPSDTQDEGETGAVPTRERRPSGVAAQPAGFPPPGRPTATGPQPFLKVGDEDVSHGELTRYPVPVLLAAALRSGFDGQLVVRPRKSEDLGEPPAGHQSIGVPRRAIIFENGRPMTATSGLVRDRLIEIMLRRGKLTAKQYNQCRGLIETTGRRAGALLVEMGVTKADELFPLVRWHFRTLVYACFSWKLGSFWLEPRPQASTRILLEGSGSELLLEGLRRRYDESELLKALGGSDSRLQRSNDSEGLTIDGLAENEKELAGLCNGMWSLARILDETRVERGQALAVLRGLELLGFLQLQPNKQPTAGAAPRAGESQAVDRARLEQRLRLCREADYFTLLGVTPQASAYEIRKAHETVAMELAPGRLAAIDAIDLDREVSDARYVVDEALEVLTDDALREAYRQSRFQEVVLPLARGPK